MCMDKKTCVKCLNNLDISSFNKKKSSRDGLQSRCKFCEKERYITNKASALRHAKNRQRKCREEYNKRLILIKKSSCCVDCGNTNPVVLQFDHVRGTKVKSIATMVHECLSWSRIEEEIKKCELVCANCHQIRTFTRNGWLTRFL